MIVFAFPAFLWLLLLVPVILVGYGVACRFRLKRIKSLGDPRTVRELMPHHSPVKGWVRISLFSLAFAFFAIGLSRPRIGAKLSERKSRGTEIMICLDVSNSMMARDYSPCRLERAKLAISQIVDRLQGDRIGLVIFAGSSFVQLPITTDYVSAKMFLSSIDPLSIPVQGTAIGDAIYTAAKSFSAQSEKSRVIILITDGENHEDDPVAAAREAASTGIRIYTVGVGSSKGEPVPIDGELLRDSKGNIVVSRLDEDVLKKIAAVSSGSYIHAGLDEFGLNPIIQDIKQMEAEEFSSIVFEEYEEQFMYFFWAALLLLAAEMLVGERKSGKKLF